MCPIDHENEKENGSRGTIVSSALTLVFLNAIDQVVIGSQAWCPCLLLPWTIVNVE